jgi:hypothetical protein
MLKSDREMFLEEEMMHDSSPSDAVARQPLEGKRPIWPPPPRPRPPQGMSMPVRMLTCALVLVLLAGGLGLIVYATTGQYNGSLQKTQAISTNVALRNEMESQATLVGGLAQTAIPLATQQAQIVASATAQDQPTATAQAASAQAQATATVLEQTLTEDTAATPTIDDPLIDNSQNNQWDVGYADNNATGCHFVASGYEAQEVRQGFVQPCFADATSLQNFVYQVTLTIVSGSEGGMLFRGNKDTGAYYLFRIDRSGYYALDLYNGNTYTLLTSGTSTAILTGTGESNDLTVLADGHVLSLFANETYLASVNDATLSSGQIGVAAITTTLPTTVDFSNAEVWSLSA